MKKLLIRIAGALLAVAALSSCTKENEAYWAYETTEIRYYDVDYYYDFVAELKALVNGPTITVTKAKSEVGKIVDKYDGNLGCTVYFKTGPTINGPWTTKKTWVMRLK